MPTNSPPAKATKPIMVAARTHSRIRDLSKEIPVPMGDITTALLDHGLDAIARGDFVLHPPRIEAVSPTPAG